MAHAKRPFWAHMLAEFPSDPINFPTPARPYSPRGRF